MHANEISFGVEFEVTLPNSDTTPIGGYHRGRPVAWLPTGWNPAGRQAPDHQPVDTGGVAGWRAERDSSIRPQVPGRKGCEFVSPKLRGPDGLAEVLQAVDALRARGGRVNRTTGLHVTTEWNGDAAALARLISLVGNHEKAIFASTGTRRRERTTYTKRIKPYGDKDRARLRCEADRYHLLNLTHLARGRNRVEFRAFAGTLNKTKVMGHLMMSLGLVELALARKRCTNWDYAKRAGTRSCWDRPGAGEGETELNRLFYRLGWTKGWYKGALRETVFGRLADEGRTPDMKAIKRKLLEMARKYDRAERAAA